MKHTLFISFLLLFLTGCSATWSGVKEDTSNAFNWTKEKVNDGASYVKEKTE
jgi:PBP1b-binding outer membrane lipoprotein LpoB